MRENLRLSYGDTGLGREGLYKALSWEGNPEFVAIMQVITLEPKPHAHHRSDFAVKATNCAFYYLRATRRSAPSLPMKPQTSSNALRRAPSLLRFPWNETQGIMYQQGLFMLSDMLSTTRMT